MVPLSEVPTSEVTEKCTVRLLPRYSGGESSGPIPQGSSTSDPSNWYDPIRSGYVTTGNVVVVGGTYGTVVVVAPGAGTVVVVGIGHIASTPNLRHCLMTLVRQRFHLPGLLIQLQVAPVTPLPSQAFTQAGRELTMRA